jgi:hypothetical protein
MKNSAEMGSGAMIYVYTKFHKDWLGIKKCIGGDTHIARQQGDIPRDRICTKQSLRKSSIKDYVFVLLLAWRLKLYFLFKKKSEKLGC